MDIESDIEAGAEASSLDLRRRRPLPLNPTHQPILIADFFCGAGGLSLAAHFAALAFSRQPCFTGAADIDVDALDVYNRNFRPRITIASDVGAFVDYQVVGQGASAQFLYEPEIINAATSQLGNIDLLVAGPPCQGHSNLNNHTRRDDARNEQYIATVASAVGLKAKSVVIENVREVAAAKGDLLTTARALLEAAGYSVEIATLDASRVGISQTRKRSFLVASRKGRPVIAETYQSMQAPVTPCLDAIGDLVKEYGDGLFNQTTNVSAETQSRIDHLFDEDAFELPNHLRPECHKDGHTYGSVYGRLRPDRPAGTITQGFMTMGQGRFVHPTERRCLTPHEAARIQGFPDFFRFETTNRPLTQKTLLKLIGNAVPPRLGEVAIRAALGTLPVTNVKVPL